MNQILVNAVTDIQKGDELYANYGTQIDRQGWKYKVRGPNGETRIYTSLHEFYVEGDEAAAAAADAAAQPAVPPAESSPAPAGATGPQ